MAFRENTPEQWAEELEKGLEYRRRFGLEDKWGDMEAIYYGVHPSMVNDGANIFLSQGDAMLSTLSVPSPAVKIGALEPGSVEKAPILEALDNSLLNELNMVEEVEQATLHAYLFGKGILKIGYDSEWGYDPSLDLGGTLQLGLTLSQLNKTGSRQIEYNAVIQPGMPWVRSVLPHDFVVPWGVRDIDSSPWVAQRVVRHIDDLRADQKYEHTRRLQPQISMRDFVDSYRSTLRRQKLGKINTEEAEYVEFYEIHDRRTGKIYCITWDYDHFLRNEDNLLQVEGRLPFVDIDFTPRARAFWTTPDVYYLLHCQNELSDIALQRTKQRRISGLKFLYDGDSITPEELMKILSPDVGVAAKVESGRDLSKAVVKLENQPNQTLSLEEDTVRANAREQIGFSRNQLGEYSGGRKTAREVSAVDRSSQLRMSRRGLKTKRLYERALQVINGIIFRHWTLGRYVKILGPEQAEFLRVSGPTLRGRYSYKVELVDQEELDRRGLDALQLYGLLGQDPSVDPLELRKYLINRVNDPAFGRLFNANIRAAMQQQGVQQRGGGVLPQGGGRSGAAQLSQVQQQNGQEGLQGAARLLAGRGNRA